MSKVCIITGANGLVGSEAVTFFAPQFDCIIGIDNDQRKRFFGDDASTLWNQERLVQSHNNFQPISIDIQNFQDLKQIFEKYNSDIELIIHTAAQPSHDWAAKEPFTDFGINANGTHNLLELTRSICPKATFIYTSTNKVYGDNPNKLPLKQLDTRWELDVNHEFYENGINESMSIDHCTHSLFGVSKLSGDLLAQEYGRYFDLNVGVFRGGCLTGPNHSGTKLHGFLSYLMKCAINRDIYTIYGHSGKQVRDNIHSLDLINMFSHFHKSPKKGEVYNVGGGRFSNCSMSEAIMLCEKISGNKMNTQYNPKHRIGDHIWWISDTSKFQQDYPGWIQRFNVTDILEQIFNGLNERQ